MFGSARYNYENFRKSELLMLMQGRFRGPKPGERAPDFKARTLDGEKIKLSDFRGEKNIVLTFGSVTCPMTAGSIRGMNELYDDYRHHDVEFLLVYVREAHPGEEVPAHDSYDGKVEAAEFLRDEEEVEFPIIVDDLDGSIHRKYGLMPNSTYMIDKSGRVAFRALWTRPNVVEDALQELLERQEDRDVDHAVVHGGEDRSIPVRYGLFHSHRALRRGGESAVENFRREMGIPGRVVFAASRAMEPITLNPGKAFVAAALAGGIITAGLLVGLKMRRQHRRIRSPYDVHPSDWNKSGGYEAVGI
jgi:alkyl hydroperoxide reductase subunit AhpC